MYAIITRIEFGAVRIPQDKGRRVRTKLKKVGYQTCKENTFKKISSTTNRVATHDLNNGKDYSKSLQQVDYSRNSCCCQGCIIKEKLVEYELLKQATYYNDACFITY